VIEEMQRQAQVRYTAAMAVFRGLPPDTTFEAALTIKTARGDPCAQGWRKQNDGNYSKVARCEPA